MGSELNADSGSIIEIRQSKKEDIPYIMPVFESARRYMRAKGNLNQWDDNYPGERDILSDIENGNSYVGLDREGEIVMVFAFIIGEDPTYLNIFDGTWPNDERYGTIHRIASSGKGRGMLKVACNYCFKKVSNIRIDTHEDNKPMLSALANLGFKRCGIIICRDDTPRIAFHKKNC